MGKRWDRNAPQASRAQGDKGGMNQRTLRIPGTLKHTSDEQTDVALQEKAREHADCHPGVRYLADVLCALHAPGALMRSAKGFTALSPRAK